MIKVCILTSVHPPFDTRIFDKEAKSLAKAGYEVTLIAQHDKDEIVDGIRIVSLPKSRNRIERMTRTVWLVYRKALKINADIYHFHDPELIPIGLLLKCHGKLVIYDIHEDTRQLIILKNYIPLPLRYALSSLYALYEDYACRGFSALVTPQEKMTSYYSTLNLTATVKNFVDISVFHKREVKFSKPILLHAGTLDVDRGLYNMVNAAKVISGDFSFYLAGKLNCNIDISSLSPLIYLGELDQRSIIDIYEKSNIGIILYNNVGQYTMASAIKCYEYMANSMPIIMPNFGEWVDFNDTHQCGINVNVLDAKQIASAVDFLIKNPKKAKKMGENGRMCVVSNSSWQIAFEKLDELYQKILA